MGYAFLSYSTRNQQEADTINNRLNKEGIDTWMAPGDIPAGKEYAGVITRAIKECSCLVLILSKESQESVWVAKEIERAINYRKPIIPAQIEECVLNDEFELYISTNQIVTLKKVNEQSDDMRRLIESVRNLTGSAQRSYNSDNSRGKTSPVVFNNIPGRKYLHAKDVRCQDQPYREGPISISSDSESFWVLTTVLNTCPQEGVTAENVRLAIRIDHNSDLETVITSEIICADAIQPRTSQSLHFASIKPFALRYRPGTAFLYSEYYGLYGTRGIPLTDDILTENGTLLGFRQIDGKIPGGTQNTVTVSIQVDVDRL